MSPSVSNVVAFSGRQRARATLHPVCPPDPDRRQAVVIVSDPDRPKTGPRPGLRTHVPSTADGWAGGVDETPTPLHSAIALPAIALPATPAELDLARVAARPPSVTATGLSLLLVDDDALVRQEVTKVLRALLGASVCAVGSIKAALEAVTAERFDAVILEAHLPDGDGCELCAAIRARGLAMPIVVLSRSGQEADVVRGLDAGAHDYVVKPFRPYELAARMRAQLRLSEVSEHAEVRVGNQIFHIGKKMLSEPGQPRPVRLTVKEAALLRYLHRANGEAVSGKELLDQVWGYHGGAETHTVASHVYRLRCKVEPRSDSPRVLLHGPGGYRLLRSEVVETAAAALDRRGRAIGPAEFDAASAGRRLLSHHGASLTT